MRKSLLSLGIVGGLLVWSSGSASAGYFEQWNDDAAMNHNWKYWVEPDGVAALWNASGGVADSGHIVSPLGALALWGSSDAYWPIYTMEGERELTQGINLVENPSLTSVLSAGGLTVSLGGGTLHYFIGEWLVTGPDPGDYSAVFYRTKASLTLNAAGWDVPSAISVAQDADWELMFSKDSLKKATDLFLNPQQYGLVVVGGTMAPSGDLLVDNFGVIPEPVAGGGAAFGLALWAFWRARIRPR